MLFLCFLQEQLTIIKMKFELLANKNELLYLQITLTYVTILFMGCNSKRALPCFLSH